MQVNVNVFNKNPNGEKDGSWTAIAKELPAVWSQGATMQDAIEQFNRQYRGFLEMNFQDGDKIEFKFAIII